MDFLPPIESRESNWWNIFSTDSSNIHAPPRGIIFILLLSRKLPILKSFLVMIWFLPKNVMFSKLEHILRTFYTVWCDEGRRSKGKGDKRKKSNAVSFRTFPWESCNNFWMYKKTWWTVGSREIREQMEDHEYNQIMTSPS